MTDNAQARLIQLELSRDELGWLCSFLHEERRLADIDYENVESLHTDSAISAAQDAINRERAKMLTVANKIDKTLAIVDAHEGIARKIAATLPAEPLDAMTPPAA